MVTGGPVARLQKSQNGCSQNMHDHMPSITVKYLFFQHRWQKKHGVAMMSVFGLWDEWCWAVGLFLVRILFCHS